APDQRGGAGMARSAHAERIALVIDDEDHSADLIRLLLEAEGFTVSRAATAEDALAMATVKTPSLITLDLQLPGSNGWDFLYEIRQIGALSSVPVVVVSGVDVGNMGLNRGASAVLQKPISRVLLKESLANLNLNPEPGLTHTVLIVDDDPKAVEVIAAFLPKPGYAVVRAYGGAEAIALAERLHPDLILLDLMMPEVSGFDVVEALQRAPDTAGIPVLVVTAKQITEQDRDALNSSPGKVVRIVEKAGFNKTQFMSEVRRALQAH